MSFFTKCSLCIGILSVFLLYVPFLELFIELEQYSMEDNMWKEWVDTKGSFLNLSLGQVHFILEGNEDAPLVVILHGISTSSVCMKNISKKLVEEGFRTLRFDFYARGHSSSPPLTIYNEELFVTQTIEILDALKSKKLISNEQYNSHHVVGWSLGGAVSLVYASEYPQRIRSALLIAPPGLPFDFPLIAYFALIPHIGELLQGKNLGRILLEERIPSAFVSPNNFMETIRGLKMLNYFHLHKEGFVDAYLSSLRNFKLHGLQNVYEKVGKEKFPVLFIWGDKDGTVPLHCGQEALKYIPRAELSIYPAGHLVFVEKQDEIKLK